MHHTVEAREGACGGRVEGGGGVRGPRARPASTHAEGGGRERMSPQIEGAGRSRRRPGERGQTAIVAPGVGLHQSAGGPPIVR